MKIEDKEGHDVYLVDSIVDRRVRRKRVEYRVRWKGFPPEQDSWEPLSSIREPCFSLIQDYHRRVRRINHDNRRYSLPQITGQTHFARRKLNKSLTDSAVSDATCKHEDTTPDRSSVSSTRSQPPPRASKKVAQHGVVRALSKRSISSTPFDAPQSAVIVPPHPIQSNNSSILPFLLSSSVSAPSLSHSLLQVNVKQSDSSSASEGVWTEASGTTLSSTSGKPRSRSVNRSDRGVLIKRSHVNPDPTLFDKSSMTSSNPEHSNSKRSSPNRVSCINTKVSKRKPQGNVSPKTVGVNESTILTSRIPSKLDSNISASTSQSTNSEAVSLGAGRKSVTIMLKASPTHEFQSAKGLHSHRTPSPNDSNQSPSKNQTAKKRLSVSSEKTSKSKASTENKVAEVPFTVEPAPSPSKLPHDDLIASRVFNVVSQLKVARRRPIKEVILTLCKRQYDMSSEEVLASLDLLVSQGTLHAIEFTNGISYRFNPNIVARGDLSTPTNLSARIKAKYANTVARKKTSTSNRSLSGPKRVHSRDRTGHSLPKLARREPSVRAHCHRHYPIPDYRQLHSRGSSNAVTIAGSSNTTNHLTHLSVGDEIYFNQSAVIVDNMALDRDATVRIAEQMPLSNSKLQNDAQVFHPTESTDSVLQSRVFVVPPASPLKESSLEMRLNNLPHRRLQQSTGGATDTHGRSDVATSESCSSGNSLQNSMDRLEIPSQPSGTLRRSSVRQTEAPYKFRSICVKKNVQGGFTEIWLQSPGSQLKNAFTVQVLEELTAVLNQAIYDTSRLVMISGMGTVFSSGIDLTLITGPLPNICSMCYPSNESSSGSSASSTGVTNGTTSGLPAASLPPRPSSQTGVSVTTINDHHGNPGMAQRLGSALRAFLLALSAFPKPVVVGVNGPAMGLGVAMLPLCDLIYVSDAATFQLPYTKLGQTPEGASSYTLGSLIGLPVANELLLASRKLSAREAVQRGLASDLLYPKSFKQELLIRCQKLAASSCMSLETTKCIMRTQHRERIEFVINTECKKLVELWQTSEFRLNAFEFLMHEMGDFL